MIKAPFNFADGEKIIPFAIERKITPRVLASFYGSNHTSMKTWYSKVKQEIGTYNEKHKSIKYNSNKEFLNLIKPASILDAFCEFGYYTNNTEIPTITNDKNILRDAMYHLDANDFLKLMKSTDLVDIDPFGCPVEFLPRAIDLAQKGLIITFGEFFTWRRFKKEELVKNTYGLSLENYNADSLIVWVQNLAKKQGKTLEPVIIDSFSNKVLRIYFKVGDN